METKKILMATSFYPPYHVGGACVHVYYLANELAKQGHEIHVIYCRDSYYLKRKENPDHFAYKNHEKVVLHPLKSLVGRLSPISSYILGYPFFKSKIKQVIEEENFDVIHYHNVSLLGPKVFEYGNSKKIYTAHDHWLICPLNDLLKNGEICKEKKNCTVCAIKNGRPPQLWRHSKLLEKTFQEVDLMISPSQYMKEIYPNSGWKTPIKVIPNFVPPPLNSGSEKEAVQEGEFFLFVGMLEPMKGILGLLSSFERIDEKLLIAGAGSLEKKVRKVIKRKNMKNVTLLGWKTIDELRALYRKAKATILPSPCPENSPLVLLESLSLGTPVIGTNMGGIPEIVGKVDQNLIFDPTDLKSLESILLNFNQAAYNKNKIRDIYRRYHSPEAYLKEYEKLLN